MGWIILKRENTDNPTGQNEELLASMGRRVFEEFLPNCWENWLKFNKKVQTRQRSSPVDCAGSPEGNQNYPCATAPCEIKKCVQAAGEYSAVTRRSGQHVKELIFLRKFNVFCKSSLNGFKIWIGFYWKQWSIISSTGVNGKRYLSKPTWLVGSQRLKGVALTKAFRKTLRGTLTVKEVHHRQGFGFWTDYCLLRSEQQGLRNLPGRWDLCRVWDKGDPLLLQNWCPGACLNLHWESGEAAWFLTSLGFFRLRQSLMLQSLWPLLPDWRAGALLKQKANFFGFKERRAKLSRVSAKAADKKGPNPPLSVYLLWHVPPVATFNSIKGSMRWTH